MPNPSDLVEASGLFAALDPQGLQLIARESETRDLPAGAIIFRQGDDGDGLYIVRKGHVRAVLRAQEVVHELASIGPGGVLGEMSLLGRNHKRKADALAGPGGASVIFMPLTCLRDLRERFPNDFALGVLGLAGEVVDRLDVANHALIEQLAFERSESLRRDLVMHDLRSPLALIESGVHSLLQRPEIYGAVPELQRRPLQRIGRNLVFLRLLVDSILEIERTRMTSTQLRVTTLREVLEAAAAPLAGLLAPDRWMGLADEAPLAFLHGSRLEILGKDWLEKKLSADPLRLAQVLLNLIGNALRYTNGALELSAQDENGKLFLELSDHGAGVPEALREQLFDAFKQRELQDRKLPVGKGFGLAGVREMVRSMGGDICILDRRDGTSGARFRVELPVIPA